MKNLWTEKSGLTLVEVVVATLLLSIGILTAFTVLAAGITVNDVNQDRTYALNLAQEKMEQWKYNEIEANSTTDTLDEGKDQQGNKTFNYTVTKTIDPNLKESLIRLKVEVSWNNEIARQRRENQQTNTVNLVTIRRLNYEQ